MLERHERGTVTVLSMTHGKVNALDRELLAFLREELAELAGAGGSPVVLTGTGRFFSAGMDLKRILDGGREAIEAVLAELSETILALLTLPRPVVAAVNGHAIAGGWVLACACDYRLAASGPARLGLTELLVGVPFPAAALEVVRAVTPPERLEGLLYTGKLLGPEEAEGLGMVDGVVADEDLLDRAVAVAEGMGAIPEATFALCKRQLREPLRRRIERGAERFEAEVVSRWTSEETLEGIRRYVEENLGGGASA
jgi:enoyl-CoA hydratase